jgi:hypothetical protein
MRITTESGSVYEITDHGVCKKTNREGRAVDAFKLLIMKPVPPGLTSWEELHELPQGDPLVGDRLFLSGLDNWWLTTPVQAVVS